MTETSFVDSNILIYAHDLDAGAKQTRAATCLRELWDNGSGRMRTQVLQEFCVNVTRKIPRPLSGAAAREIVRNYACWVHSPITPATVVRASEIGETWKLSFWDSMIVAGVAQALLPAGRDSSRPLSWRARQAPARVPARQTESLRHEVSISFVTSNTRREAKRSGLPCPDSPRLSSSLLQRLPHPLRNGLRL
jgi:predicted nucleic acid-binding protein